ncbi:MAG: hypothetical protein WC446_01720 [Candidatus Paceibacterota bacterium]
MSIRYSFLIKEKIISIDIKTTNDSPPLPHKLNNMFFEKIKESITEEKNNNTNLL